MTIEAKLDEIIAKLSTPETATVDLSPILMAVSNLSAQVTALQAVVGTEAAPAPAPAPAA